MKKQTINFPKDKQKTLIMPTAKILSQITHDGKLDNNAIKTTLITKQDILLNKSKLNKINFVKDFFDINENNVDKYSIEFNEVNDELKEEILLDGEKIKKDLKIENFDSFLENKSLNIEKNFRDLKIKSIKNNLDNSELQILLSNLKGFYEKSNKRNFFMDSHKYDESILYKEIEEHYKCKCKKCNYFENNFNKSFYEKDIYLKKLSQDEEIRNKISKKDIFEPEVKDFFENIEKNDIFSEEINKNKFSKNIETENKIIYSQSVLNNILQNKICFEKKEYENILESVRKKKIFLDYLKNKKFNLNNNNLQHLDKMKEKLLISEKIFLENNKKMEL